MHNDDLEDTHLCIKCNATIVGLEKYIEHRKQNCLVHDSREELPKTTVASTITSAVEADDHQSSTIMGHQPAASLDHTYDGFHFAEPGGLSSYLPKTAAGHGGKTSKTMTEAYDLTYELGADVFFSSLQLQSVQPTGGKTGPRPERPKEQREEESWHGHSHAHSHACTDTLMKAVREIGESKKHDEADFKPLKFVHDSPEASEDEEEEDEPEAEPEAEPEGEGDGDDFEGDDDEDEDYDPIRDAHATGGKWRHSPPAVPASHTGGKWKPEHRPQLHTVTHMERISPSCWDEQPEEPYTQETPPAQHPPEDHTKGKWVPGSKQLQRLEYRDNIDLTKLSRPRSDQPTSYWCNICCRKLKTRANYEQHLRTGYHERRAEVERQLEQAELGGSLIINKDLKELEQDQPATSPPSSRRRRRSHLLRCELCRHSMARHLMGKHLISHYHYRRLQQQSQLRRQRSLHAILEHMPSIVRQSPFQCLPCRFYANTETGFLAHWSSVEHVQQTQEAQQSGGRFWCSFCQFECASNDEMWQHLLEEAHQEVLLALNRSVPICIGQRLPLSCSLCGQLFNLNVELRRHFASAHVGVAATASAADEYQCRYRCGLCGAAQRSRIALQRHEKHKHRLAKYYCAICRLEFATALQARRHRSHMQHKRRAKPALAKQSPADQDIEHLLRVVLEEQPPEKLAKLAGKTRRRLQCTSCRQSFESGQALAQHRSEEHAANSHACLSCGSSFQSAQALGRHSRSCQPKPSTSSSSAVDSADSQLRRCDQCSFSAKYESDLLYHRFFHTHGAIGKDELLDCPLCPKRFRKHSLRAHLRNHTDERIFECGECEAKFARRHNLKNHMTAMHRQLTEEEGEKDAAGAPAAKKPRPPSAKQEFQCGTCGKILAKKYSLKLHELSHTEVERRYRCQFEDCQYAGLTPESLKTHLVSHAKGIYKCEHQDCSYVGKSALHLKRHLKCHVTEQCASKWFACDQCEFRARVKGHLKRHMRRHTGEKPHKCPHCDFQCSNLDNLRKHIVKTGKHPGKFIYECDLCVAEEATDIFRSNNFKEYQAHLGTHKH